jgi:hypothetical protein
MDMLPMQARFATQDQAESAMRKLAALRSDRFRLERVAAYGDPGAEDAADSSQFVDGFTASVLAGSAIQSYSGVMASAVTGAEKWGVSPESGANAEFNLSADVPGAVAEQARTVILQAGGQML